MSTACSMPATSVHNKRPAFVPFPTLTQLYIMLTISHPHNLLLSRHHQVILNSKHLPRNRTRKPINLSRILLNLARIQHDIQPTRLLRQLEQSLPLVFRKQRLLACGACRILRLALLLPRSNLLLFARKGSLVVLVVVEFGVMGFDAVEEEVAGLFEEGIDAQVERFEVGCEWWEGSCV